MLFGPSQAHQQNMEKALDGIQKDDVKSSTAGPVIVLDVVPNFKTFEQEPAPRVDLLP